MADHGRAPRQEVPQDFLMQVNLSQSSYRLSDNGSSDNFWSPTDTDYSSIFADHQQQLNFFHNVERTPNSFFNTFSLPNSSSSSDDLRNMGRNTDKLDINLTVGRYITHKEWSQDFGGKKANSVESFHVNELKGLPFYSCALSLQPFETPVATQQGIVYEITNILPWLKKHKIDPITGQPMTSKDLFPVQFHKNEAGKFHCPITFKEFNDFTRIVTIKPSGHVYSWDAIEELNIKPKAWKDLLTDVPFTRADIIDIQDPLNPERRKLSNFHYIKLGIKQTEVSSDPLDNIQISETKKKMLRDIAEKHDKIVAAKAKEVETEEEKALYTRVSASAPSLTSTSYQHKEMRVDARDIVKSTDKKGYARLHTSLGDINVELHCDLAPKTCENFLGLAERGYYDGTLFHRLVPHFMGGDPTATGRGGKSIWGRPFQDEFNKRLQHSARGILSMANSGPDSNNSQFFISFAPTPHLDNKHSVFGKVVRGNEVLSKMESIPVDKERPLTDIILTKVTVYENPFREEDPAKVAEEKKRKEEEKREGEKKGKWFSNPVEDAPKAVKEGVGKYIGSQGKRPAETQTTSANKKPSLYGSFDYY
ncbi:hypothetical protein PROFUN_00746 [Planoprotostelium fungivorum]|uniref:RING-type E3 ubiquitin transferase n=1 Tax=Planoprotostelium fungivorum TaxID=1890364 RepID=A0A2P6MTJ2_9EUKA|nr:hypothetical protein PROFUN_07418 [Planoprotostelium fungivorum]PRP87535.1 hypothetical protein PROFUN_00746 [Planoprotostelium fungivorum]